MGAHFLQPSPLIRDINVRVKLKLIKSASKGRELWLWMTPSSVHNGGVLASSIFARLEQKEVHIRVSCPRTGIPVITALISEP